MIIRLRQILLKSPLKHLTVASPARRPAGPGLQIFITKKYSRNKIDIKWNEKPKVTRSLMLFLVLCGPLVSPCQFSDGNNQIQQFSQSS